MVKANGVLVAVILENSGITNETPVQVGDGWGRPKIYALSLKSAKSSSYSRTFQRMMSRPRTARARFHIARDRYDARDLAID
ncbi:hypothetical protein MSG28_003605 [Choristoneura fumiferana]|uniref:Uncharacterized protein n=1 Tax=Choristoneura fumiferana TaxID=7141 RepID=A0ACC0KFG0_CHOFU|nr:hypothetical protein MSG28_003605 [Choristoneura fumiferana]